MNPMHRKMTTLMKEKQLDESFAIPIAITVGVLGVFAADQIEFLYKIIKMKNIDNFQQKHDRSLNRDIEMAMKHLESVERGRTENKDATIDAFKNVFDRFDMLLSVARRSSDMSSSDNRALASAITSLKKETAKKMLKVGFDRNEVQEAGIQI